MLTFYDPKNDDIFEDSKEICSDFEMIMITLIKHLRDKLHSQRENWTLNQYSDKYPLEADAPKMLKSVRKDIMEYAKILAGIKKKFGRSGQDIEHEIESQLAKEFFKVMILHQKC